MVSCTPRQFSSIHQSLNYIMYLENPSSIRITLLSVLVHHLNISKRQHWMPTNRRPQSTSGSQERSRSPTFQPSAATHNRRRQSNSSADQNHVRGQHQQNQQRMAVTPPIEEDCAICIDAIDTQLIYRTLCNHSFHLECLQQWVDSRPNATCPICRGPPGLVGRSETADSETQAAERAFAVIAQLLEIPRIRLIVLLELDGNSEQNRSSGQNRNPEHYRGSEEDPMTGGSYSISDGNCSSSDGSDSITDENDSSP